MSSGRTFKSLLSSARGDAVALLAPHTKPLTYADLKGLIGQTIASLNKLGIGRNDRVAIVLPNGAEMAAAFISIASGATSAPLNEPTKSNFTLAICAQRRSSSKPSRRRK